MSANRATQKEEEQEVTQPSTAMHPEQTPILQKVINFAKHNKIMLGGVLIVGLVFIGLTLIKEKITPTTGQTTDFSAGSLPDFSKINQDKQEAQGRTSRLDAIGGTDESNGGLLPTEQTYTQYSTGNSYSRATEKEPQKQAIINNDNPSIAPTSAYSSRRMERKRRVNETPQPNKAEKEVTEPSPTSGFNTVVLSSSKEGTTEKEYIKAAIYGHQTLRSGSQVRIRLLENLGDIPSNTICTGVALLGGNRLTIALTAAQVHGKQVAIKKIVYDRDLLPGIAFVNQDAQEQSLRQQRNSSIDQTTNSVINNIPSVGGLAGAAVSTGAGIVNGVSNAVRYGGIQKRAGEIEVEEGYRLFIK